jgi:hypothetical protein
MFGGHYYPSCLLAKSEVFPRKIRGRRGEWRRFRGATCDSREVGWPLLADGECRDASERQAGVPILRSGCDVAHAANPGLAPKG